MLVMTLRAAIVYHSRKGHTEVVARSVAEGIVTAGVQAAFIKLPEPAVPWDILRKADAIVFGCPTHFGNVSAEMKHFMDTTDPLWHRMEWENKLAAGFTCAGEPSGDKVAVLLQMCVFAGQHGMIWVGVDPLNDVRTGAEKPTGYNRHGGYLGAMADARGDELGPDSPPPEDRLTAQLFGRRIGEAARRWSVGRA
jgi:NAD(P)H dehydrogenase (quinone)